MSEEEKVLVIPTTVAFGLGVTPGFSKDRELANRIVDSIEEMDYWPRSEVEEDESLLQLIPYCVLTTMVPDGITRVFAYDRHQGSAEERLRGNTSIGIGGHINQDDPDGGSHPYLAGMHRELDEEVHITMGPNTQHVAGLIYDDSNPVGRVHLGIVHLFDIGSASVEPREKDIADPRMLNISQLHKRIALMENWSQLCVKNLFPSKR